MYKECPITAVVVGQSCSCCIIKLHDMLSRNHLSEQWQQENHQIGAYRANGAKVWLPRRGLFNQNLFTKQGVKRQVVDMAINGSGIQDTSRVLSISKNTVISTPKKVRCTDTR
jgi:hypothetical protein